MKIYLNKAFIPVKFLKKDEKDEKNENNTQRQKEYIEKIREYFEKNKNKPHGKWFSYIKSFGKQGKQGTVGLIKFRKKIIDEYGKNSPVIYKISNCIDFSIRHEYLILNSLSEITRYCPHFCKTVGTFLSKVNPQKGVSINPFKIETKYPIEKEVLVSEYVEGPKLGTFINKSRVSENTIYSMIKQILLSLSLAQSKKKFTHYDLHSHNILVRKCCKDLVFLYVFRENYYAVPTRGCYPVIIDFGYSYTQDINSNYSWGIMSHTDSGFYCDRFDWLADAKLFLITMLDDLKKYKSRKYKIYKNIIRNIFWGLPIDWKTGWDNFCEISATEQFLNMVKVFNTESALFREFDFYCVGLIQSLIILPFEEQNYDNIEIVYKTFIQEFIKIENSIGDYPYYKIYIFKGIVNIAREVRKDYISDNKNKRNRAVIYFSREVVSFINKITSYCYPSNVNYEKLLCSLLCLSRYLEGIIYKHMKKIIKYKNRKYKNILVNSIEQIYGILECNIPSNYVYNENTTVVVINSVQERYEKFKLSPKECEQINKIPILSQGIWLNELREKELKRIRK